MTALGPQWTFAGRLVLWFSAAFCVDVGARRGKRDPAGAHGGAVWRWTRRLPSGVGSGITSASRNCEPCRNVRCRGRGASHNSLRALRALRSDRCDENVDAARCARRPCRYAPRHPTNRPRRVPPAATLGLLVFGASEPGYPCARDQRLGGGGPWGQRAARLCGAEERRACGQREARSSSCSSPLSEHRERSERSEFGDAGARAGTARQSARSAPDRHSEAPRAVPMGLRRPPAKTPGAPTRIPAHNNIRSLANVRNGPEADERVCARVPRAIASRSIAGELDAVEGLAFRIRVS